MIDFDEIRREITSREAECETSFTALERLAPLYCAALYHELHVETENVEPQALTVVGESDFLRTVSGKDSTAAWKVMDELMETLAVVNERVYQSVMRKLGQL